MKGKILYCIVLNILICFQLISPVIAQEPAYQNYTYSYEKIPFAESQAYIPTDIISGISLGVGAFNTPKDVFVAKDGKVYIVDSGNNRIVILNKDLKLTGILSEFINNGKKDTFKNPNGIFLTDYNLMYIADTDNGRIIVLDENYNFITEYGKPKTNLVTKDFPYKPVKIAVDSALRIFVVSLNVDKGLIELDKDGNFETFYGAIPVNPNIGMLFWRAIATNEQKSRMTLELPTEYSSVDIDETNFVYGVVSVTGANSTFNPNNLIKRLNPFGNDVLKRNGFFPPSGDVLFDYVKGVPQNSKFSDVCVRPYGIYSTLDSKRGRVFTYDENGNLLCVFGRYGEQMGDFGNSVAFDIVNDTNYLVVDAKYNHIVIFKPTEYMNLILNATRLQYERKYSLSEQMWSQVLKYSSKSDLAYDGMGRVLLRQGKNKEAMKYFELANDRQLHSKAYGAYRDELIGKYFNIFLVAVILLWILLSILIPAYKKRKRRDMQK